MSRYVARKQDRRQSSVPYIGPERRKGERRKVLLLPAELARQQAEHIAAIRAANRRSEQFAARALTVAVVGLLGLALTFIVAAVSR